MPVSTTAVLAVIFAMALAGGLSALAARSSRRQPSDSTSPSPWWGALAVGLAYTLGHLGVATPSIPPGDVTDRIPVIALVGALVAAVGLGGRGGVWGRIGGCLGLAALTFVVMLGPVLGAGDFPRETVIWLGAAAVGSILATLNVALLDVPGRRTDLWAALVVFSLGAGIVLLLSNSAVLFQLAGVLAVVLAAALLGAWGLAIGGGIPVALAVLSALIVEGFVYAFLPATSAALLAGAPLTLWLTRIGPIARRGPRIRATIAAILILIPVAVAAGLVLASKSDEGY